MKHRKFWVRENRWLNWLSILGIFSVCYYLIWFQKGIRRFRDLHYSINDMRAQYSQNDYLGSSLYASFLDALQVWYFVLLIGIILITIVLFMDFKKDETKEWIWSLPIKKKDMFVHKWLRGMLAYTIPWLFTVIGTMVLYARNIAWVSRLYQLDANWKALMAADQPLMYIKALVWVWIWGTACYSIWFFMQIVCRSQLFAAIFGSGIIVFSSYMLIVLARIKVLGSGIVPICEKLEGCMRWFLLILNQDGVPIKPEFADLCYQSQLGYRGFEIQRWDVILVATIIGLCLFLSYRNFLMMNNAKEEGIFTVAWVRYMILTGLGFSIGSGLVANMIYYQRIRSIMFLVSGTVIFTIVFVVVVDKLLRRRGY